MFGDLHRYKQSKYWCALKALGFFSGVAKQYYVGGQCMLIRRDILIFVCVHEFIKFPITDKS